MKRRKPNWLAWAAPAAAGVVAGAVLLFRSSKAAAASVLPTGEVLEVKPDGTIVDAATGAPPPAWTGDVRVMQAKLNGLGLGVSLAVDGKAGTQTCRAAEKAIAEGKADSDIQLFAKSKVCGYGIPRAPCGISGPVASDAVKKAILDAAVARGYPRDNVNKAVTRESRWHPAAVACAQTGTKHAIAGGLIQFIPVALRAVGFDGSPDQFASLSGEEQLPYVLKFIQRMPQSTLHLPGDFGLALFWPVAVSKPNDYVIADKNGPNQLVWEQNPGLRSPGGGPITAGSVRKTGH